MLVRQDLTLTEEIDLLGVPGRAISFVVPGQMRGKGRPKFTTAGGFARAYTPERTVSAENWVKACGADAMAGHRPILGPLDVQIRIAVPVPKSWPVKKRADALEGRTLPTGKPDLDNCVKLICDALNGIVWGDDSQIVSLLAVKRFAAVPETHVVVEQG